MRPFDYSAPTDLNEAVGLLQADPQARVLAGGSDLLGELKEGTTHASRLVSLARIESLRTIWHEPEGLVIGAAVTIAELEQEPRLLGPYRILAEAARGVATPEIRNQGTLGGNLCQRPRCLHFRSPWIDCAKKGGTGCPAEGSPHQPYLSIFGGTGCFAVNASDLAPALIALRAQVRIAGPAGTRSLEMAHFFAGPEREVRQEHTLVSGEIVTAVVLPAIHPDWRGTYLKARERTAGDFPLVSVACGAWMAEGRLRGVRVILGGVAPTPRQCPEAEALLENQVPDPARIAAAARAAFAAAQPLALNGYKIELGRALVIRAATQIARGG